MYTLVTRYGVHNPLLLVQWYWVFGMYQHVAEGAQWTKDHLDVQLYEDPSHCLRETIDVVSVCECHKNGGIAFPLRLH